MQRSCLFTKIIAFWSLIVTLRHIAIKVFPYRNLRPLEIIIKTLLCDTVTQKHVLYRSICIKMVLYLYIWVLMVLHVAILILLIILCVYVFKCSCVWLSCDQSHDRNQEVDQYKASSMSNKQGHWPNTYTLDCGVVLWIYHTHLGLSLSLDCIYTGGHF